MNYSLLYETFQYWKQYAWVLIRNELLPELKYKLGILKRKNKRYEEEDKKQEEMKKNPFYIDYKRYRTTEEQQNDIDSLHERESFAFHVDQLQTNHD